ncbi:hypothetical protein G9A89_001749 [Geosiphon pyriformis]|nr:hypothetical protein G9A89_001749 [Geosiphon pyriformis]
MVTQKDMENGTRNCASLVENCYQEGATGMTYQAEEERVMQLANTQSLSMTGVSRRKNLEKKMEIENQQSQNQLINQQDSPDSPKSEKFVVYTDLEQITNIQYFDNRHLGIIPERAHPTDAGFDLHYPEDQSTMLPSRSITKIDLKIAVEILPGIMVQIAL